MMAQGNKIQILVDAKKALQNITNTGEAVQQTYISMLEMQKEFEKRITAETQLAIVDVLAQYEIQENFVKLKETFELVITQKEKERELMFLKIDTVASIVSELCKHLEMTHKHTGEKSIQTDVRSQVATLMSSATPKRKIKHASLKEDSSSLKSIAAVVKKSLTEFQEKSSLSFKKKKEQEFTQLCSGLQAQLLQASTTLKTIMEKSFEELSENYTTAMRCITNLHEDNTQRIVDHVNSNKECLTYLFLNQEKLGNDLQTKVDTILSTSQLIIKDFGDLKQSRDPNYSRLR